MRGSWYHDSGALGILAEALGDETEAQSALDDLAEDGWALLHRSASPSVRLARWLDQDPYRQIADCWHDGVEWRCLLYAGDGTGEWLGKAATRDAALSAALDQAEAATPEGTDA